jgi:hypothetical protein
MATECTSDEKTVLVGMKLERSPRHQCVVEKENVDVT